MDSLVTAWSANTDRTRARIARTTIVKDMSSNALSVPRVAV